MRLATFAEDILCVGLNLDLPNAFKADVVSLSKLTDPLISNIIDKIYNCRNSETSKKVAEEEITNFILREYYSLPPTPEKSDTFYFSRFLLGQISSCEEYEEYEEYLGANFRKYVFIPDSVERRTRQSVDINYIISGFDNSLQSTVFIPLSNSNKKIILINIYEIHKESSEKDSFTSSVKDIFERGRNIYIPISSVSKAPLDNQKIIELNMKIDMRKYKRYSDLIKVGGDIKNFLDIQVKSPVTYKVYKSRENTYLYKSDSVPIDYIQIIEKFNEVLNSQRIQENDSFELSKELINAYRKLLTEIGKAVYPFKSLIRKEAHFQAVLQGFFDYYSDKKLKERVRALVLTEFQTGAGDRIDMIIQIIGASKDDINKYKEYIPVGLELKYTPENPSEVQIKELKEQMSRYATGAAIKSITDGRKIAVIGVVFCNNAPNGNSLILMYEGDETIKTLSARSSIMSIPKENLASGSSIPGSTVTKRNASKTKQAIAAYTSSDFSASDGESSSKTTPFCDEDILFPITKNK